MSLDSVVPSLETTSTNVATEDTKPNEVLSDQVSLNHTPSNAVLHTSEEDKTPSSDETSEWLDLLENREILKKVIKEGDTSIPKPEKGSLVVINVTVRLKETQEIISNESYQNYSIFCGECDIIHGIDLVIPLMYINETSQVIISPRFGYGKFGKNNIPPNATLDCIVELLSSTYVEDLSELEPSRRIEIAKRKKERGNFYYSRQEYSSCIVCYKKAIEHLESIKMDSELLGESIEEVMEIRTLTLNNLAVVQMKIGSYDAALVAVNKVLEVSVTNIKALYRKAKIFTHKGHLDDAIEIFTNILKLDPDLKLAKKELDELLVQRKRQLHEERNMYRKMLNLEKTIDKTQNKTQSKIKSSLVSPTVTLINTLKSPLYCIPITVGVIGILTFNMWKWINY